jgi:rod shape-determining protein MreC
MPLGTLDRSPPPFFRQGPSALSKLVVLGALALFLMAADIRFKITQPVRLALATALQPLQWAVLQPILAIRSGGGYFQSLKSAQAAEQQAQLQMAQMSLRANQVETIGLENTRLRGLLALRERLETKGQAAQVLYDAADPYTRKVVIDIGLANAVALGSPVLDEQGVVGQVTRVYAGLSEVTLIADRDQAIPVLNTRTGIRGIAFGDAASGNLELRFVAANADVQAGDLLTTSGVDGVYPPGLAVAKVEKVERRVDSAFARIICLPSARVAGTQHVWVLNPVSAQIPQRPADEAPAPAARKGVKK